MRVNWVPSTIGLQSSVVCDLFLAKHNRLECPELRHASTCLVEVSLESLIRGWQRSNSIVLEDLTATPGQSLRQSKPNFD